MTHKFSNDLRTASAVALDVKASGEGRIEGYASTIGTVPDRHGDIVLAGAFAKSLGGGNLPVMLWAHKQEQPIGRWTKAAEDQTGLYVEGSLNLNTDAGRQAFEHVKAGDASGLSIGFVTPAGGREYRGEGIFALKEIDLLEISIVAIPANPLARITGAKSLGSKREAADWLHNDCGLSRKEAARFAAGGYPALAGNDHHDKAIQLARQIDRAIEQMRTK